MYQRAHFEPEAHKNEAGSSISRRLYWSLHRDSFCMVAGGCGTSDLRVPFSSAKGQTETNWQHPRPEPADTPKWGLSWERTSQLQEGKAARKRPQEIAAQRGHKPQSAHKGPDSNTEVAGRSLTSNILTQKRLLLPGGGMGKQTLHKSVCCLHPRSRGGGSSPEGEVTSICP